MDDEAFGLIAWILIGVGGVVGAIALTGGIMYAADAKVGADVTDARCAGGGGGGGGGLLGNSLAPQASNSEVDVKTNFPIPGIDHTVKEFDDDTCRTLDTLMLNGKEPYAEYHIRSGHTILYDERGGQCLYDSETGVC